LKSAQILVIGLTFFKNSPKVPSNQYFSHFNNKKNNIEVDF